MRIYISGPITGVKDYKERFMMAAESLKARGYTVVNPAAFDSVLPADMTYEEHMSHDFFLMNMCGAIAQMPGWEKSTGANREYGYALGRGMNIVDLTSLQTVNTDGSSPEKKASARESEEFSGGGVTAK